MKKINLKEALLKSEEIYNNTIYRVIKFVTIKAFYFSKEEEINIVIKMLLKVKNIQLNIKFQFFGIIFFFYL